MIIPDLVVKTKEDTIYVDVSLYVVKEARLVYKASVDILDGDTVVDTLNLMSSADPKHWYCELYNKYQEYNNIKHLIEKGANYKITLCTSKGTLLYNV